jgi:hypothetical protein
MAGAFDVDVLWDSGALDLLNQRDRYTRQIIQDEFRAKFNTASSTAYDADASVTPVADQRFLVIWRPNATGAIVRAVVPNTNRSVEHMEVEELRDYIERAVKFASKGRIKL